MAPNEPMAFPFAVPVVSAIIERRRERLPEILIQVRWKPDQDPIYSGMFEIPAGTVGLYENVYDAVEREVFEETGLKVTRFRPDVRTAVRSQWGDAVFAFVPFCCQQQISGKARVGFVFVCAVEDREPVPAAGEVKEIRWMERSEVRRLVEESPERIFTFQLPVLEFYLSQCADV